MKYTQGEWKSVGIAIKDKRDEIFYHTDILCNDTIRVARSSGVGEDLALANARLIAATPDLLDAAQEILSDFQQYGEVLQVGDNGEYGLESAIGRLATAITKAEP